MVYPPKENIFAALNGCPPQKVKVVILGQDPYHDGNADGLSFSARGSRPPPSLRNIFLELQQEIPSFQIPSTGSLHAWQAQGVFLLNYVLTVRKSSPLSHHKETLDWPIFTRALLEHLNSLPERIIFMLWGTFAKGVANLITNPNHKIITTSHPSPYSSHLGFSTCSHFTQANQLLLQANRTPIHWHILPPKITITPSTIPNTKQTAANSRLFASGGNFTRKKSSQVEAQVPAEFIFRVLFKSGIHNWKSASGGTKLFFQMEVMDGEGQTHKIGAYNFSATLFYHQFLVDDVYKVTKITRKKAVHPYDKYYRTRNPISVFLHEKSLATCITKDASKRAVPRYIPNWISLGAAAELPHETLIDILGCVVKMGPMKMLQSKRGNEIPTRTIWLRDATKELPLSLWYKDAKSDEISLYSVLGFTGVMVNMFRNKLSISTKHCAFRLYRASSKSTDPYFKRIISWATSRFQIPQIPLPIKQVQYQKEEHQNSYIPTKTHNVSEWGVEEVSQWLTKIGMEKYKKIFLTHEMDGSSLFELEREDLKDDLKMKSFKDRKIILKEIKKLRAAEPATSMSDTEKIRFAKDTAFYISTENSENILKILSHYQDEMGITKQMIQQILLHLPLHLVSTLAQESPQTVPQCILDHVRRAFVKSIGRRDIRMHSDLSAYCLCLFPSSIHHSEFLIRSLDVLEEDMTVVTECLPLQLGRGVGTESLCSQREFRERFDAFTNQQLSYLNWENCFVAGGAVLACLLAERSFPDMHAKNVFFDPTDPWRNSDIDIFLVGLREEEFEEKIREIYESVCLANNSKLDISVEREGRVGDMEVLVVRTKNCVSFVSGFPRRTVQVILKEYSCYNEVLASFDLDCVAVGCCGEGEVWCSQNAERALCTRTNFLDEKYFKNAMNMSTMKRILKYQERGFGTRVYHSSLIPVTNDYKLTSKLLFLRFMGKGKGMANGVGDKTNGAAAGGYDDAYLPYGPGHTPSSIAKSLQKKEDEHKGVDPLFFIFGPLDYCLDPINLPNWN